METSPLPEIDIDAEIERDALQCWDLWRKMTLEGTRNPECVPNLEVWTVAYVAGVALGRELEREDCALLADGMGAGQVAEAVRAREDEDELEIAKGCQS